MTQASGDRLLAVEHLHVSFGALHAVDDVSFVVPKGQLIGLIGTNGAGKSTVINTISGFVKAARGSIRFDDRELSGMKPHSRAAMGIGRTFQNLELFPSMSVVENVTMHWEATRPLSETCRPAARRDARERALALLGTLGLAAAADRQVGELSYADRKLTEFARAIMADINMILLDEPVAGVASEERKGLVERVRQALTGNGIGGVVVEHDMGVIRELCSYVYVMDAGKVIAQGDYESVMADEAVQRAYLGTAAD
jgi:branched-chain amino acid transport system ATP-binding protein